MVNIQKCTNYWDCELDFHTFWQVFVHCIANIEIHCVFFVFENARHPDKTDDPLAETKFVEIKKAYELLSDNERRSAYDLHGVTHEDAFNVRNGHDYSQYGRFAPDPFEEFFG